MEVRKMSKNIREAEKYKRKYEAIETAVFCLQNKSSIEKRLVGFPKSLVRIAPNTIDLGTPLKSKV